MVFWMHDLTVNIIKKICIQQNSDSKFKYDVVVEVLHLILKEYRIKNMVLVLFLSFWDPGDLCLNPNVMKVNGILLAMLKAMKISISQSLQQCVISETVSMLFWIICRSVSSFHWTYFLLY